MSRTWKIILMSILLIFLVLLLLILVFLLFFPATQLPPRLGAYDIPEASIGYCSQADIDNRARLLSGQGDKTCIAWTEFERKSDHSLTVSLRDPNDSHKEILILSEAAPIPECISQNRCYRVVPVNMQLSPGVYHVTFQAENSEIAFDLTLAAQRSILPQPILPQITKLTLTKKAFPTVYTRVGDNIRYDYVITNTGNSTWRGSTTVMDDSKVEVQCQPVSQVGNRDGSFDPNESITCYATYVITENDIKAGSVTSTARIEGVNPVTTTITSGCHLPEGWVIYDVRSTDTLVEISTWFSDLTVAKLMEANCLNTSTISTGQKIYVPASPLPAKISGIVFMDPNHNDIQDRNELGLSGAPVKITDSNGAVVATTTTGANGVFEIDLPPGTYFVFQFQVILLPGEVRNQRFAVVPVP